MKTEKDIEEMLDNVKIPSDEEVEFRGGGAVLWARVCLVVGT